MRVDVAVATYRAPGPIAWAAIQAMIEHSRCKCWQGALASLNGNPKRPPTIHHPSECPLGKHDVQSPASISSSILHWGRNAMIQACRPDSDYILLCDDDMCPDPDHLDRLLAHQVDIAAGLCTKRIDPPMPNARRWIEQIQNYGEILAWGDTHMLEVDAVGTAFMLLSRKVINDVAEAYHPEEFRNTGNGWWFEYVKTPKGGEWGEDIGFCWKATRLGFKIHCDLTVNPGHVGDYIYRIEDYLQYQAEVIGSAGKEAGKGDLQLVTK